MFSHILSSYRNENSDDATKQCCQHEFSGGVEESKNTRGNGWPGVGDEEANAEAAKERVGQRERKGSKGGEAGTPVMLERLPRVVSSAPPRARVVRRL